MSLVTRTPLALRWATATYPTESIVARTPYRYAVGVRAEPAFSEQVCPCLRYALP
jgi:hypothetical protein